MLTETPSSVLREEMFRHVIRFNDKQPDWDAFINAKEYPRAQFRYVGAGGATEDRWAVQDFAPAKNFTVSLLYVPPGGGGPLHGHAEEEVFFVISGQLTVSWGRDGELVEVGLGPKDMLFSPPGHLHGYFNHGVEGAYMLIMLGSGRPSPARFPDRG
jgi:mannose-6-phosphate isomerase-like protein (cupin superfamily)